MVETLTEHDAMALQFLIRNGPDQPGVINSEEVMCATLFFLELSKRGLVHMERAEGGPIFSITPAGRTAIANRDAANEGGRNGEG